MPLPSSSNPPVQFYVSNYFLFFFFFLAYCSPGPSSSVGRDDFRGCPSTCPLPMPCRPMSYHSPRRRWLSTQPELAINPMITESKVAEAVAGGCRAATEAQVRHSGCTAVHGVDYAVELYTYLKEQSKHALRQCICKSVGYYCLHACYSDRLACGGAPVNSSWYRPPCTVRHRSTNTVRIKLSNDPSCNCWSHRTFHCVQIRRNLPPEVRLRTSTTRTAGRGAAGWRCECIFFGYNITVPTCYQFLVRYLRIAGYSVSSRVAYRASTSLSAACRSTKCSRTSPRCSRRRSYTSQ